MTQEALKLALEALERSVATCFDQYAHQQVMSQPDHFMNQAITAIKEALAQTEQKPVAWRWENAGKDKWLNKYIYLDNGAPDYPEECEPLYTTPPQRTWVGLTLDEIALLHANYPNPQGFALALQDKLKEKNGYAEEKNT